MSSPKITVITPTNSEKWYSSAKASMLSQTMPEWQWVVVCNGGFAPPVETDPRIKCVASALGSTNVGALKREACLHASAPYVLEFDHDDELHVDALRLVVAEFEAGADFVYSDCARVDTDGNSRMFDTKQGWVPYADIFEGPTFKRQMMVHRTPPLLPQNISRIWYAPDHLRAWRAEAYWKAGGHDVNKSILDDLDLMQKMFVQGAKFKHIPRCLYRYLIHGENTWLQRNAAIQTGTLQMHDERIYDLSLRAYDGKKLCVDLGGGIDSPKGWTSCDRHNAQITADLEEKWPFEDNSVGAFRAHDFIEHIRNPIHLMNEAWRSLCHGGLFLIEVPSTDGRGAFQDPTHVSYWNSNALWYWTKERTQRYIKHAGAVAKFNAVRIVDYFPTDWHKTHNIPYVRAHLAAIKSPAEPLHGISEW